MNLQNSIMGDAATINSPYPGLYAQGQRYQDIQNMMSPQYSRSSPTDLYKQARADLDGLANPSVPSARGFGQPPGLLGGGVNQSPQVVSLLDHGGDGGMGGIGGTGSGHSPGFGEIGALGLLGMVAPGFGTAAQVAALTAQDVSLSTAIAHSMGVASDMDAVMSAMNNNVNFGFDNGIGAGFGDVESGISAGFGMQGMGGVGGFGSAAAEGGHGVGIGGMGGMGMGADSLGGGNSSDNDGVEGAAAASAGSGSGGDGAGDSSVICTYAYNCGELDPKKYKRAKIWTATRSNSTALAGYHWWAVPIAKRLRKESNPKSLKHKFWVRAAQKVTDQMNAELGAKSGKRTLEGYLWAHIVSKVSFGIGTLIKAGRLRSKQHKTVYG